MPLKYCTMTQYLGTLLLLPHTPCSWLLQESKWINRMKHSKFGKLSDLLIQNELYLCSVHLHAPQTLTSITQQATNIFIFIYLELLNQTTLHCTSLGSDQYTC